MLFNQRGVLVWFVCKKKVVSICEYEHSSLRNLQNFILFSDIILDLNNFLENKVNKLIFFSNFLKNFNIIKFLILIIHFINNFNYKFLNTKF